MLKKIEQVCFTYLSRPLFLLVAAIYVLAVLAMVFFDFDDRSKRLAPRISFPSRETLRELEQFEKLQQAGRLDEIEYVDLQMLKHDIDMTTGETVQEPGQPYRRLIVNPTKQREKIQGFKQAVPQMQFKGIKYRFHKGDGDQISKKEFQPAPEMLTLSDICKIQSLQRLDMSNSSIKSADLEKLTVLKNLEELDISNCHVTDGLHHLASLKKLHTLIINNSIGVNDDLLEAIAELKQLKTLVIKGYFHPEALTFSNESPTQTRLKQEFRDQFKKKFGRAGSTTSGATVNTFTDRGVRALAKLTNLQVVYVTSHGLPSADLAFEKIKQALPNVSVRHGWYDQPALRRFLVYFQITSLLLGMVSIHLFGQFSQAAGRLMPGFFKAHFVPPVAISVGCIALMSFHANDHAYISSWAVLSAAIFIVALLNTAPLWLFLRGSLLSANNPQQTYGIVFAWMASVLVWPFLLFDIVFYRPLAIYLNGDFPLWIEIFFWGGLGLFGVFIVQVRQLSERVSQSGLSVDLKISSPADLQKMQSLALSVEGKPGKKLPFIYRITEKRFEKLIPKKFDLTRLRDRIQLWRLGNVANGWQGTFYVLISIVSFGFASIFIDSDKNGGFQEFFESGAATPFLFQFTFTFIIITFAGQCSFWRLRLKLFCVESLRPFSRETIRKDIFSTILYEIVLLMAFPILVTAGLLMYLLPNAQHTVGQFLGTLTVLTGVIFPCFGIVMWVLTIRRNWVALLTGVFMLILTMVLLGFWIGFEVLKGVPIDLLSMARNLCVLTVLGAVPLKLAWNKWGRMEFDR